MSGSETNASLAPAVFTASTKRRILLIEDTPSDAALFLAMITAGAGPETQVVVESTLEGGLERLFTESFSAVVLDLGLPDSQGVETVAHVHRASPHTPIVVLTGRDDLTTSVEAIRLGAQECLIKGCVCDDLLTRALQLAAVRMHVACNLAMDASTDELTGLYNRRGFFSLGVPMLNTAARLDSPVALLFFDVDGLKPINDLLGHKAGDHCLQLTANVLRQVFRKCDILARLGGDEFAVLATGISCKDGNLLVERLQTEINLHNAKSNRTFDLSISVGIVTFNPRQENSLDAAMALADRRMFEQKRARKRLPPGIVAAALPIYTSAASA